MLRLRSVKLNGDAPAHWIVISDSSSALSAALAANRAVIGLLTGENKGESFSGVSYLVEDLAVIDDRFAERVVRRHCKLPWRICEDKQLLIRELTQEDIPGLYALYGSSDRYTGRRLSDDPEDEREKLRAYQRQIYEFYEYGLWAVVHKRDGMLIGTAGYSNGEAMGQAQPFLEYQIHPEYRRKGLGKACTEMVLEYGEEELGFTEIYSKIYKRNLPSMKLAKSLGFTVLKEWKEGEEEICLLQRKSLQTIDIAEEGTDSVRAFAVHDDGEYRGSEFPGHLSQGG